ncbi:type II toxin-antitoxin system HipA family toxin [Roseateles sp.]|uniref:type II toxin-antitoxin system HipA family toxin n=1 Tax=Roseateles sp. TaxID=1971397 RepID=UPI0032637D58
MSLWWLGEGPASPRRVGQIFLTEGNRKVGLEYSADWLQHGFPLSEDLPLGRGVYVPKERDMAAGAVDDARPDRWGERVIRNLYRPSRLSVLEYLYFAGDDRFGALGVSTDAAGYQPSSEGAMASLANLDDMQRAVAAVLADEKVDERLVRLVKPGPSFGGARPKSLIEMDGAQWVVKFSEGEDFNTELVEHATMRLASQCGLDVAHTRALPLARGHAVAVRRFDRAGDTRSHVISANTVLRANGLPMGYPELAQSLRRIGRAEAIRGQQKELFKRMVFNILMDNTDDHEKNHAFVRAADGFYDLSPAYDVVPSVQGLGQQQLRVGKDQADASIENALSEVQAFGLTKGVAIEAVKRVAVAVDGWKEFFRGVGVSNRDLDQMSQYIDGPNLKAQRAEFIDRKTPGLSR